ncbi:pseudouridine synthase [Aureimonas sp. Leaf454]|uniref:pseudouridine synthase n=1 Tax=Aureimonas sp. Leaf454 TaxID=1736381 RepID=UPI0009EC2436|nr:pseudouridine synthase [Aureimonas sp. Leaf454]
MTDKSDDTSGKDDGSRPRSGGWGAENRPQGGGAGDGEKRRVFKPRPLGDGPRPARADKPAGTGPRKSFGRPVESQDRREGRVVKPRPLVADGVPKRSSARDVPRETGEGPRKPRREAASSEAAGPERIAKRLARAGIASRRDAEGMIADGRVKLNGKLLTSPAVTVTASDRIEVDNEALPAIERTRLWLFHKPAGVVTTNRDPEGRPTVFDRLPEDLPRVLSVGRLDINTEGLLLLTNDGGLSRILELPATGWLRRYRVRAFGSVTQAQLDELRQGIAIDGVFYGAIEATLDSQKGHNVWLTLGLREGKNREVKRILGHLGLDVNRLIRLSFGPFQLGDLPEGAVREIKGRMLRDQLGERLIEESGADFDAPIVNTFTNKVVEAERPDPAERKAKAAGAESSEWVSATESRPNKKKFGAAKREDALGRLDTRPQRAGFGKTAGDRPERGPRPDRGDRPERGPRPERTERGPRPDRPPRDGEEAQAPTRPGGGRRMANVWMAPGARPLSEKQTLAREARAKRPDRPKPIFGRKDEGGEGRSARPEGGRGSEGRPTGAPRGAARPAEGDRPSRGPFKGPRGGDGAPGGDRPRPRGPGGPGGPKRGPRS